MAAKSITPEQYETYKQWKRRNASGGGLTYQEIPAPVVPIVSESPSSATEFIKGALSGGTGELSDLVARQLIGTEALQPANEDGSIFDPYHLGYGLGTVVGLPTKLGTWALAKTAGTILPKARPIAQSVVANALANAGLAGVSAAGQGEDIGEAVMRGAVVGGAAGGLIPKVGPWINRQLGVKIIPTADEEVANALKGKTSATTETKTPTDSISKPKATVGPVAAGTKRTWDEAAREAYYRSHPDEIPPPSYTILTDDQVAGMGKSLEEEQILKNLFPGESKIIEEAVEKTAKSPTFTSYISDTINSELDQKIFSDKRFDYSDLKDYANKYITALSEGVDPKSKGFPKHRNPFQKAIKDFIDTRYGQIASDWQNMTISSGDDVAARGVRLDPEIATPEVPKPAIDIPIADSPTGTSGARPVSWTVSPEGEVTGPGLISMNLPSVYRRGPERPIPVSQQIGRMGNEERGITVPSGVIYPDSIDYPVVDIGAEGRVSVPPGVRPLRLTDQAPEYVQAQTLGLTQFPPWARRVQSEREAGLPELPTEAIPIPELPAATLPVTQVQRTKFQPTPKQKGQALKEVDNGFARLQKILSDKPITKKSMIDRLAQEQQVGSHENLLRDTIESFLGIADNPQLISYLPKSTVNKIRKIGKDWDIAQQEFNKGGTRLASAESDVGELIKRMKLEGKPKSDIAKELAMGIRKRVSQEGMLGEGKEISGGEFSGLVSAERPDVPIGGKADVEWIALAGKNIKALIGDSAGDDLISRAYSASSPEVVANWNIQPPSTPSKGPGLDDLKLAADIVRLRRKTADNPDAIYLELRSQHPELPMEELRNKIGETVGKKPKPRRGQVSIDPTVRRNLSRLSSDDEAF